MKRMVPLWLAMIVAASFARAQFYGMGSPSDSRTVVTVKSDGACALTNETVAPRKLIETQVSTWERYSAMSERAGDEDDAPVVAPPPASSSKSLTNDELAAKLRKMYESRSGAGDEDALKIEKVEVSTNTVRVVLSRSFGSVKELASQGIHSWGPQVMAVEDARFEIDTNRNLRITFTPAESASHYAKNFSQGLRSAKMKFEWKLALPGKILSSGFPNTADNATWITLDSEKADTIDAAVKLMASPTVITAEAAGLKLDEPLETKKLVRAAWKERQAQPDLPVSDAAENFLAEPVGISVTTLHCFPEGTNYLKLEPELLRYSGGTTGTVISAKLFPPKGRTLMSVSKLRVKAAKDDQGRAIPAQAEAGEEGSYREFRSYDSERSEGGGGVRIELRTALPAPDAKTIDLIEAEAVAFSIGGWKELVLTNVQADAKKEIDLSDILPGATLIIKKATSRSSQKSVEASLRGPATVQQLELKIKSSSRQSHSSSSEHQSKTAGGKTTRSLTVQSYDFDRDPSAKDAPVALVVRYPQDPKRERVQFKLTALDLL